MLPGRRAEIKDNTSIVHGMRSMMKQFSCNLVNGILNQKKSICTKELREALYHTGYEADTI